MERVISISPVRLGPVMMTAAEEERISGASQRLWQGPDKIGFLQNGDVNIGQQGGSQRTAFAVNQQKRAGFGNSQEGAGYAGPHGWVGDAHGFNPGNKFFSNIIHCNTFDAAFLQQFCQPGFNILLGETIYLATNASQFIGKLVCQGGDRC